MSEVGKTLDLDGVDSDLKRIERNYFFSEGVFLVAEHDKQIVGFAGALKKTETVCQLKRLYVSKEFRGKGVGRQLMEKIVTFARDLDYHQIDFDMQNDTLKSFLKRFGIEPSGGNLTLSLKPSDTPSNPSDTL